MDKFKIDVEKTILSAGHSEELVRNLINEGKHNEEIHNTIKRNIDHLSLILSKEEIQKSNSKCLKGFKEAVDLDTLFITV